MKLALRLAVSTVFIAASTAVAPHAALAVCASGGMVSTLADCIAEKAKPNECPLEWSITPTPPTDIKTGQPTTKISCLDNDPSCDADVTPGQCTFMVAPCVNVTDGRISCTPTDGDTYLVKKPSAKDATRPDKNRFAYDNRRNLDLALDGLLPTATADVCGDPQPFVVPLKGGIKKATFQIQVQVTSAALTSDKDTLKFTCLPNPTAIATQGISSARQITNSSELIGGPMAMGRIGDWIIENDRVRFIVRDVGRDFSFMLTYGGHIIDADFQRPSGPGRDNYLAMTPLINISSTDNPTSITVLDDGSGGGAAVLQTSGPDDLMDPLDPQIAVTSFFPILSIPPLARDNNIPVTVMNEYSLVPGDDFVEIETIVNNTGGSQLDLYIGDYTSGGGQLETVIPGLGFGDAAVRLGGNKSIGEQTYDWLGWFGFGDAQGISYGLIPQIYDFTSSFAQSGVTVPVYGQNLVGVLLAPDNGKPPGILSIAPGGMNSYKRWFAVSPNGMGGVVDARHKLVARGDIDEDIKTGWVQGVVSVGGVPVDGARVTIAKAPGSSISYDLANVLETSNGGHYQGTVEKGTYVALVRIPGYPYDSGNQTPLEHELKISGGTRTLNLDMPATGWVRVDVTDGVSTLPIAAKVSVVGPNAAPDLEQKQSVVFTDVTGSLLGYDAREKTQIHGIPAYSFAGPSGTTGAFAVPPGTYQFVVSHGPEYSAYKTNLTVVAGDASTPQVISATVVPVVDTTGFISADNHVHLAESPDSRISKNERIISMLAEGVDYFTATNHDFVTDLAGEVAALGATSLIKTGIGQEITYFNSGHFNAYPIDQVAGPVTHGSIDWGRAGEPAGLGYPSDFSYDLSPEEMALESKAPPHNAKVVQANHFNSGSLGYFRIHGMDTTQAPPQSDVDPALIRQDPSITNLYTDELTALEIWIESSRGQNGLAIGENLGDLFNMLNNFNSTNPGLRKTAVCDSDTHSSVIVQAGGPRNMIASSAANPGAIDPDDAADRLNEGRSVCTNGPFMRVSIAGNSATASHAIGSSLLLTETDGTATVNVNIQSPTWADFDQVLIYVNNVPTCSLSSANFVGAQKNVCTPAVATHTITPTVNTVAVNGDFRLEANVSQPITFGVDSWVVVVVRGRDNISEPQFPVNPQDILPRACSVSRCKACGGTTGVSCGGFDGSCNVTNGTLAELTDGNLNQCGVLSLGISNPIFIDKTGDGLYKGVAIP